MKSVVALCGLASCGWLAGVPSFGTTDALTVPTDANADADADVMMVPSCTRGLSGIGSDGSATCPMSLTAGVGESCAIAPDGLYCWGQNLPGIGNMDSHVAVAIELSTTPVSVQLSSSADLGSTISVGCYLQQPSDGVLTCWGDSTWGQVQNLEADAFPSAMTPVRVTAYAVGADHVCVTATGSPTVHCWGRTDELELNSTGSTTCNSGECSVAAVDTADIVASHFMVAGAAHTCVAPNAFVSAAAMMGCWGSDGNGQLGISGPATSDPIQPVVGPNGVGFLGAPTAIALGGSHTCAIVGDSTYCWGNNAEGQLGTDGVAAITPHELTLQPTVKFMAIAAGTNTTCAIDVDNGVWCWGSNLQGQAGQGPGNGNTLPATVAEPTPVNGISHATSIAVGDNHACAILADGDIMCWGDNTSGELGDGKTTHPGSAACSAGDCSWTPVPVTN
jgi:alpha-tubulin suppressor-like RCC1 family protein